MQRRALLATLAAGVSGTTAGCGYRLTGPIANRSFTRCDDCDWADRTPDPGRDPVVVRDAEARRVTVYGFIYVGSSSCNRAVLRSLDLTDGVLRVVVGVGEKGVLPNLGCTADMSAERYRVVVRFRDSLPDRVVVEEEAAWDPEPTPTPSA